MSTRSLWILCAPVTLLWALVGLPWMVPSVLFVAAWPAGAAAGKAWRWGARDR